ncbi:beta-glucuronidase, partial [Frankliniella occidentalis]|uniref:Beta-glucuronidase n=1 Tax=Frankliniella occidentalis TaxID=133901 RepID=A0A9C6XB68_FRAOC
ALSNEKGIFHFKVVYFFLQTGEVIPMPVPASYNDVTTERYIRDHVGVVYYDRTFFVPANWDAGSSRVWMRFGSVHYAAKVWINGHLVMMHEIGHLPFEKEITSKLRFGAKNRVTVEVDNTLYQQSIPQGRLVEINTDMGPKTVQTYTFDFFNYAGIHRPVYLYTTPHTYLDDMTITTDVDGSTGYINYALVLGGVTSRETPRIQIDVLDADGNFVYSHTDHDGLKGRIEVPDARLWWPYLMDPDPGYLYTLQVRVTGHIWGHDDVYRQPVGIRTVEWTNSSVLINGKPIYIRGFGKHEDGNIRGKGLDYPTLVRDFNLFKWVGGNAFRTSHYPYAEEIMDFADRMGIMVIDECPSVDTENYSPTLLQKHKDSLGELIRRDKNRPSVIMWSVANEARTQLADADAYFK